MKHLSLKNSFFTGVLLVAVVLFAYALFPTPHAENLRGETVLSSMPSSCNTAGLNTNQVPNASTTLVYAEAGTATTTLECPLGANGAKEVYLNVQFTGSSTFSTLNVELEVANGTSTNTDWYPYMYDLVNGSTTNTLTGITKQTISLPFASTSPVVVGSGDASRMHATYKVTAPYRYVRAVLSLASSTDPTASEDIDRGAFYAEFISKDEF